MRLLITGASGFLGRFVVRESLERGHLVRALVRRNVSVTAENGNGDVHPEYHVADLRKPDSLQAACDDVDVVIHLAAAKSGDIYTQYGGTVTGTENLLKCCADARIGRFVLISSFSVYQYLNRWSYGVLDEDSPLEPEFPPRDAYCHTKLVQERLVREHAGRHNMDLMILRPGVIYGPDHLWNARLGLSAGRKRWIRIGHFARLPLTYVENCADAIVSAAERTDLTHQTINVVDGHCPTQSQYARAVLRRKSPRPGSVTIPWTVMRAFARSVDICNRLLFRRQLKVPAVCVPEKLHARFKPLRYSNNRLCTILNWKPRYDLEASLDRCLADRHPSDS